MDKYINRLMKCGYSHYKAFMICRDFTINLSLFDLECFIVSMEQKHVGKV